MVCLDPEYSQVHFFFKGQPFRDFPSVPFMLPVLGSGVQSLVRKLRPHLTNGQKKKRTAFLLSQVIDLLRMP